MSNRVNGKSFEYHSVFQSVQNLKEYLPGKTVLFINYLNKFYSRLNDLIEKHDPKCLFIVNNKQQSFELDFGLINSHGELIFFYDEYELSFNDGNSFGIDDHDFEVEGYPTQDLFWVFRDEVLEKIFFIWILECVWNSNLMNCKIPLLYCNSDFNDITNLKDGTTVYSNLDFLE